MLQLSVIGKLPKSKKAKLGTLSQPARPPSLPKHLGRLFQYFLFDFITCILTHTMYLLKGWVHLREVLNTHARVSVTWNEQHTYFDQTNKTTSHASTSKKLRYHRKVFDQKFTENQKPLPSPFSTTEQFLWHIISQRLPFLW